MGNDESFWEKWKEPCFWGIILALVILTMVSSAINIQEPMFWQYIWQYIWQYVLVIVLVILSVVGIYLIYSKLKRERRDRVDAKISRSYELRRIETQKAEVILLYEQGLAKFDQKNYEEARKLFKEALDIIYYGQDIGIREEIRSKLKQCEQEHNLIYINKINSLIEEGDKKQSPISISVYESALKLVNKLFVSTDPNIQIENMILDKIDKALRTEIHLLHENAKILRESKLFDKSFKKLNLALQLAKKISNSELKNNSIKETNEILDQTYFIEIDIIIEQADKQRRENNFNQSITLLNGALSKAKNIKIDANKKLKNQDINNHFDSVYNEMIDEKIMQGNEHKKHMNFNESLNIFEDALNIVKKINDLSQTKTIRDLIRLTKIAKIKNTILHLGTKFARLQIMEIAEECNENEYLIITTVKEMISNNEIYGKYFKSSKSVVFDQQANIDEIDKLMSTYKDWEDKKVGKK